MGQFLMYNKNMDKEPGLKITFNGDQELEATPENTVLYTFLGRTALGGFLIENSSVNHIYIKTGEETETTTQGMYLFQQFHGEVYDMIAQYIQENNYTQILNMRQVPECDIRAYLKYQEAAAASFIDEFPDYLPDDFK